jgi:hypothetical protein
VSAVLMLTLAIVAPVLGHKSAKILDNATNKAIAAKNFGTALNLEDTARGCIAAGYFICGSMVMALLLSGGAS